MDIQTWDIDRCLPYDLNPRVCPEKAIAKVAESLRTYGWRQPIVVDGEGVIIAGHTRHKAARLLGLKTVPVHVATDLSDDEVRAYRIADNRVAEETGWDKDLLALEIAALTDGAFDLGSLGFDDGELDRLITSAENPTAAAPGAMPPAEAKAKLADRFGLPPFSVLNAREGWWQDRKRAWLALGIRSEVGRGEDGKSARTFGQDMMRGEGIAPGRRQTAEAANG